MWLKRRTPQNIVIGGAAGAFPPMIGWAAVTGDVDAGAAARCSRIDLHLDAAAFLGAGAVRARRLRRAPACRCCRWSPASARPRQILLYTVLLLPLGAGAGAARRRRAGSTAPSAIVLGALFLVAALARAGATRSDRRGQALFGYLDPLPVPAVRALIADRATGWSAAGMAPDDRKRTDPQREPARSPAARRPGRCWPCCSACVVLFFVLVASCAMGGAEP